ncbi:MAG: hypothetical protein P1U44_09710 [Vicingaceae bacterium]|nr:hypothetical protein [Vicingaceae bacterium]
MLLRATLKFSIILLPLFLLTSNLYSGNDKLMNYLQGTAIQTGGAISIADQQHMGIFQSTITQQVKTSEIKAVLKYEESLLPLFGVSGNTITDKFELIVNYDIILTTAAYTTTTITGEQLVVNYDVNSNNYVDIAFNRYQGYMEADLTITSISFKEGATSISPAYIPNDVYLELHSEVERYYEPTTPGTWRVEHDVTPINSKNELLITWDYALGAENFELEWVFIDITATIPNIQNSVMEYDWKDATRITTSNNYYSISMAYPSGMLVYRVRPVGVDLTYGNYDLTTPADWSYLPTTFTAAAGYAAGYGYAYEGLDVTKNWTYNIAYAEEGKRKEGINYFDGSAKSRQSVVLLNTDSNAIIGETMYDYEGRPAVGILPVPLTSSGIRFYEDGTGTPFNNNYNKDNYDADANFSAGPDGLSSPVTDYYSSTSTSNSLFKDFIPDAEDYPFSRTTYKRDGTDRITEQSGVGYKLRHTTSATTKYYYGSPSDQELERLFGNEVGPVSYYQKNMVKDPNGQVSIQYLDKEGRTIATALAGTASSPLLDVDYKPAPVEITADLLSNNQYTPESSTSTHVLTISVPNTVVNFSYSLTPKDFTKCMPNTTFKCSYILTIRVLDEEGKEVFAPISYTGYFDGTTPAVTMPITFSTSSPHLGIGTYTVTKTLTIDDVERMDYLATYEAYIREYRDDQDQTCVPFAGIDSVTCDLSCYGQCKEAFRNLLYISGEDTVYAYYDEDGDEYPPYYVNDELAEHPNYQGHVDDCTAECEEDMEAVPNLCDIKLSIMKLQMSPGGQYFDNLPSKYQDTSPADGLADLDGNGEPIIDGSYDIDGWLETAFGTDPTNPSPTFTQNTAIATIISNVSTTTGVTYNTWEKIRTDWQYFEAEGLADLLVEDHPEYCAYKYNCLDDITVYEGLCYDEGTGVDECTISRADIIDYEYYMMLGSTMAKAEKELDFIPGGNLEYMDFLNPLAMAGDATDNGVGNDNSDYMDEVSGPNTKDNPFGSLGGNYLKDPLFDECVGSQANYPLSIEIGADCDTAWMWVEDQLKNFLGIDGNDPTPPSTYHSIWYVMDDINNIHLMNTATANLAGISTYAHEVYKNIHSIMDRTGNDLSRQNKYQFFRGVYKFYRDYVLYKQFKDNPDACAPEKPYVYWNPDVVNGPDADTDLDFGSYNSTRDQTYGGEDDFYELVWARNLNFDLFDPASPANTLANMEAAATAACESDCENNAVAWISQYETCIDAWVTAGSLTTTGAPSQKEQLIDELKADLIEICGLPCNSSPAPSTGLIGSSDGDGATLFNALPNGPSLSDYMSTGLPSPLSSNIATFDELIAYYDAYFGTTCTETVVYPNIPNSSANFSGSAADCNCEQLLDYADSLSISPTNYSDLATALNNDLSTTYTADDVERWSKFCNNEEGDIIDLPATLECINCKCENLAAFITAYYPTYDPYNLTTGPSNEADIVATALNNEFGTSYTHGDITAMMNQCIAGDGDTPFNHVLNTNFTDLPDVFRCNGTLITTDPEEDCAAELNHDLWVSYLNLWEQELETELNDFYTAYSAKCMEDIQTRETFTAEYQLNEFMYTLYYYDQAGNLIKTVPPEGVIPESTDLGTNGAFYDDVEDHRINPYDAVSNPTGTVHQNVDHTLVTQYKYDSYNNLIWQSTPDGGETNFWYDKLGRLLLSQNEKQAAMGDYYSYTLYDELGRIYEVGELDAATTMVNEVEDYSGAFLTWVDAGDRYQVTKTFYDEPINSNVDGYFTNGGQQELRTRVSSITREEVMDVDGSGDPIDDTYDYAIHFSYDIHGNVKEIFQENNHLHLNTPLNLKHITYEYDLVSGNVNKVNYQPGQADQYYHRYFYDADNRITHTQTSRDNFIWDTDAKYFYYEHGPLARTEIGEKQVAGSDYAYTLQGWIKGVNSNTIKATRDIGRDAELAGGLNDRFATDAYGYSLGYFEGDYTAADQTFLATTTSTAFNTASPSLYNGNIRHMVTALLKEDETSTPIHGTAYRYDQANRIKKSNVFTHANIFNENTFADAVDNNYYKTEHSYDLNGNITELNRYNDVGVWMDSLNYKYANNGNGRNEHDGHTSSYDYRDGTSPTTNKNQLTRVLDGKGVVNTTDFGTGGMLPQDFEYDEIGQLVKDLDEHIDTILWDVYGKVKEIRYYDASDLDRPDILFKYDPSGNRIAKILKTKAVDGSIKTANYWDYYYYVRDASGNTMAVYQQDITHLSGNHYQSTLTLLERNIYGSSRLGVDNQQVVSISDFFATFTTSGGTVAVGTPSYSTSSLVEVNSLATLTIEDQTMTDLDITIQANDADVILGISSTYTVTSGSIGVTEVGDIYVPAYQTVSLEIDGYSFTANTQGKGASFLPNNSNTLKYSAALPISVSIPSLQLFNQKQRTIGKKVYEKSNHLGNVLVTLSDRKFPVNTGTTWDYYDPNVLSYSDYYPFGSLLPGRNASSGDYRYGFGGQEMDNEVNNITGSSYTAEFWQYDSRLGKRWNVDPVVKIHDSPYATFANNPIWFMDPNGADSVKVSGKGGPAPANFDPSTDTAVLPDFEVVEEDPNKTPSDNTNTNNIFVDPRSNSERFKSYNISNIQSNIDNNPKFYGYLLSNKSPLSKEEKSELLTYKMHSGRGAQFYQGFGLGALGGAAGGVLGSYGAFSALSGYSASFRISTLLATNLGRANLAFATGSALSNLGAQLAFNGGNLGDVNMTSVGASFVFRNPFTSSVVGSGFGFTFNKGRTGFGSGRPLMSIFTEIGVGTVAGFGLNAAHGYVGSTRSVLGDFAVGSAAGMQFNTLGVGIYNATIQE